MKTLKLGDRVGVKLENEEYYLEGVVDRQFSVFQIIPNWCEYLVKKIKIGGITENYFYFFRQTTDYPISNLQITKLILTKKFDDIWIERDGEVISS